MPLDKPEKNVILEEIEPQQLKVGAIYLIESTRFQNRYYCSFANMSNPKREEIPSPPWRFKAKYRGEDDDFWYAYSESNPTDLPDNNEPRHLFEIIESNYKLPYKSAYLYDDEEETNPFILSRFKPEHSRYYTFSGKNMNDILLAKMSKNVTVTAEKTDNPKNIHNPKNFRKQNTLKL